MCGIFCAMGVIDKRDAEFMSNMFLFDQVRGYDSCGLTTVSSNGVVKTRKRVLPALDFIDSSTVVKMLQDKRNKIMMGHNRWATKGKVNYSNAHPFTRGSITMQHNGTLTQQSLLPDSEKFVNDSENIAHSINKLGIEKTWAKVDGAAALMWYDTEDQSFNILKNDKRPLFYCYDKKSLAFYAASEKYMLMAALDRNNLDFGMVHAVKNNEHMKFTFNKVGGLEVETKMLSPYINTLPAFRGYRAPAFADKGKVIDFAVKTRTQRSSTITYGVIDNDRPLDAYMINDYTGKLDLQIGALATGELIYEGAISSSTIKYDSKYEYITDEENDTEEEEFELPLGALEEDEVNNEENISNLAVDYTSCSWCGDWIEIKDIALKTTDGQEFCKGCSEEEDVKLYTNAA